MRPFPQLAAAEASEAGDLSTRVDAIFQKFDRADAPGCALGIEHDTGVSLLRTYGSADLEHGVAIDANTIFEAGSVSKQFTAAAALVLVEQGKLGLDDDVRKHLPELPDYGTKITIAQLLGHTSGLRDWEGVVEIGGWPRTTRLYTQNDVLEIAARQRSLNFSPGAEYSYSNTGYVLLALIVERVSGESLATFSREHLFEPLGLLHTRWRDNFRTVVKGRAVAYDADSNGYHQFMPLDNVVGSGGLLTTVGDLLRWNAALDAGKLGQFITAELQRKSELTDGRTIPYARGLKISGDPGFREIWHDGETAGYEAFLARYPNQHVSVALLCNAGKGSDATELGEKVVDLLLPARSAQSPASATGRERDKPTFYAGTYFSVRTGVQMRLDAKVGGLQDLNSTLTFTGHDRFVRNFDDGRRAEFQRVKIWHPRPEELSSFVGRYTSEEALATYAVSSVDGRLVVARDDRRWAAVNLDVLSVDTFSTPQALYQFVRGADGKVVGAEVSNLGVYDLSFRRSD